MRNGRGIRKAAPVPLGPPIAAGGGGGSGNAEAGADLDAADVAVAVVADVRDQVLELVGCLGALVAGDGLGYAGFLVGARPAGVVHGRERDAAVFFEDAQLDEELNVVEDVGCGAYGFGDRDRDEAGEQACDCLAVLSVDALGLGAESVAPGDARGAGRDGLGRHVWNLERAGKLEDGRLLEWKSGGRGGCVEGRVERTRRFGERADAWKGRGECVEGGRGGRDSGGNRIQMGSPRRAFGRESHTPGVRGVWGQFGGGFLVYLFDSWC